MEGGAMIRCKRGFDRCCLEDFFLEGNVDVRTR